MVDPLADWWVHTVTVERKTGEGAYGPVFDAPASAACFVDGSDRMVRATDGREVVSSVGVAFPATVALIPAGSRVTLPQAHGGRVTTVISTAVADSPHGPNHHEIRCE